MFPPWPNSQLFTVKPISGGLWLNIRKFLRDKRKNRPLVSKIVLWNIGHNTEEIEMIKSFSTHGEHRVNLPMEGERKRDHPPGSLLAVGIRTHALAE